MTVKELEEKIAELLNKLKLQEEDEIYLLSIDEYEKYRNEIPYIRSYWWLRSPGDVSIAAANVNIGGSVYLNGNFVDRDDIVVRPALRYGKLKSEISESKKGEEYLIYNETRWKIIDKENEIAISELPIGFERFDDESNDYEKSHIRQWLLNWRGTE